MYPIFKRNKLPIYLLVYRVHISCVFGCGIKYLLLIDKVVNDLESLKLHIAKLCRSLEKYKYHSEIMFTESHNVQTIADLSIPYSNFYYDDCDVDGNKVNTYYGYICCDYNLEIVNSVLLINELKVSLANTIKELRLLFKSNPPKLNKLLASLDPDGRINLKELTRHIVLVLNESGIVNRVSFQPEIINKGKGRCLTAGELTFVLKNYFDGELGKYANDLLKLTLIQQNELLSPVGAERIKCRVNIRTLDESINGKYCSMPVIIFGKPSDKFKTNLHSVFDKSFKEVRFDRQLEDDPFLTFRSFTRKKIGFK